MTGLICLAWFVNVNNKPLGLGSLFSLIFCFAQHKESFLISLVHFFCEIAGVLLHWLEAGSDPVAGVCVVETLSVAFGRCRPVVS